MNGVYHKLFTFFILVNFQSMTPSKHNGFFAIL